MCPSQLFGRSTRVTAGHADGVHPRTIEVFQVRRELVKDDYDLNFASRVMGWEKGFYEREIGFTSR